MSHKSIKRISTLTFPWQTQDPFLFCAYHRDEYPKGNAEFGPIDSLAGRNLGQDFTIKDGYRMYHGKTIPGFPYHPHRGFETVTVIKEGIVDHADSLGAAGRFRSGDVQWITTGKGIQHSEMFPLLETEKENTLEIFQIWLNLPKKNKLVEPHFKMFWKEDVPVLKETDKNGNETLVNIITGNLKETKSLDTTPDSWAAEKDNEVAIWTITMKPEATFTLPKASEGVNRSLFYYKGESITIENEIVPSGVLVQLSVENDVEIINGSEETKILVLQGKPINEPVVQHGPFVMNTRTEISETIKEYQKTQFGGWPWENSGPIHEKDLNRFAKHSDGTEEYK